METWTALVSRAQDTEAAAVISSTQVLSGRALLARSRGAVGWLDALGLDRGSSVPALLGMSGDALALTIAGAASHRPLAPLGVRQTQHEIIGCLENLRSPVLLAQPEYEELARGVAARCGRSLVLVEDLPSSDEPLPTPSADDAALVLHTSGTTGHPKSVVCRQGALAARVQVNITLLGLRPGHVYATASPFHHVAGLGLVLVALGAGATTCAMPQFTVEAWQGLADYEVTHALAVPTMVEMLLRENALTLRSLQTLQYGAAPMPPETLRRAMQALPGVDFIDIFGQTEGSPISCLTPADHRRAAAGDEHLLQSVGRAAPGAELVIADPDETGVGEVVVRAAQAFAPDPDGWLRTGDLGRLDDEGYLYLVGRKGDKIIRGGENIYPIEVENVLAEHPSVLEVAVVGLPDPLLGETVKAFVVPVDRDNPPGEEALRQFVRASLSGFKVPQQWEFLSALPRNPNGKLLRRALLGISGR